MDGRLVEKQALRGSVEPDVFSSLDEGKHRIRKIEPETLVTYNRVDIGFKTLFLELLHKAPNLADQVYFNDIRAQTLGTFADADRPHLREFDSFKGNFLEVHRKIESYGFDPNYPIPLSAGPNRSILNGSHRLSASLFARKKVWVLDTNLPAIHPDFSYFQNRAVAPHLLEMAVDSFLRYSTSAYMAFLWPSGKKHWDRAEHLLGNIIYSKEIDLTFSGAFNLLHRAYKHMEWIGDSKTKFHGLQIKRQECFPRDLRARVVFFQEPKGLGAVQVTKRKIRELNNLGYSSVHITDSNSEVADLKTFALNANSLHYLNHTRDFFSQVDPRLEVLERAAAKDGVTASDFVLDGSFALEAYGIRKARDVDLLISDKVASGALQGWDRHDGELTHHGARKEELIFDSRFYFDFCGFKVVSLAQLAFFKKSRGQRKDLVDIKSIEFLLGKRGRQYLSNRAQQHFRYALLLAESRAKASLRKILYRTGLLPIVKYWLGK